MWSAPRLRTALRREGTGTTHTGTPRRARASARASPTARASSVAERAAQPSDLLVLEGHDRPSRRPGVLAGRPAGARDRAPAPTGQPHDGRARRGTRRTARARRIRRTAAATTRSSAASAACAHQDCGPPGWSSGVGHRARVALGAPLQADVGEQLVALTCREGRRAGARRSPPAGPAGPRAAAPHRCPPRSAGPVGRWCRSVPSTSSVTESRQATSRDVRTPTWRSGARNRSPDRIRRRLDHPEVQHPVGDQDDARPVAGEMDRGDRRRQIGLDRDLLGQPVRYQPQDPTGVGEPGPAIDVEARTPDLPCPRSAAR